MHASTSKSCSEAQTMRCGKDQLVAASANGDKTTTDDAAYNFVHELPRLTHAIAGPKQTNTSAWQSISER
jgi:hypothetical protein